MRANAVGSEQRLSALVGDEDDLVPGVGEAFRERDKRLDVSARPETEKSYSHPDALPSGRGDCYRVPARSWSAESLAGAPGFEPGNGGFKVRCLTAWRRPTGGG